MGYALHEGVPDIVAEFAPWNPGVGAWRVSPHGVKAEAGAAVLFSHFVPAPTYPADDPRGEPLPPAKF